MKRNLVTFIKNESTMGTIANPKISLKCILHCHKEQRIGAIFLACSDPDLTPLMTEDPQKNASFSDNGKMIMENIRRAYKYPGRILRPV